MGGAEVAVDGAPLAAAGVDASGLYAYAPGAAAAIGPGGAEAEAAGGIVAAGATPEGEAVARIPFLGTVTTADLVGGEFGDSVDPLHVWMSEWLRPMWYTYGLIALLAVFSTCCISCVCGFCCCWAITCTSIPELF